jgi:hypothetical protein
LIPPAALEASWASRGRGGRLPLRSLLARREGAATAATLPVLSILTVSSESAAEESLTVASGSGLLTAVLTARVIVSPFLRKPWIFCRNASGSAFHVMPSSMCFSAFSGANLA